MAIEEFDEAELMHAGELMRIEAEEEYSRLPFLHKCPNAGGEEIVGCMPDFLNCKCYDTKEARRLRFDIRREMAMDSRR